MFPDPKEHSRNGGLAKYRKTKTGKKVHQAKVVDFELIQNESGEWCLRIGESKNLFPATDVEVTLWLKLKQLEGQHE